MTVRQLLGMILENRNHQKIFLTKYVLRPQAQTPLHILIEKKNQWQFTLKVSFLALFDKHSLYITNYGHPERK